MDIDFVKDIGVYAELISNFLSVPTSFIAMYLFFFKKDEIASAFMVLLNYSQQLTFGELRGKLSNLDQFSVKADGSNREEVINILSEILGQLKGNPTLKSECADLVRRIEALIKNPEKLTEAKKRTIGHQLSEVIRQLNIKPVQKNKHSTGK